MLAGVIFYSLLKVFSFMEHTYTNQTLQGNWYEERFFDADTRDKRGEPRVRPKNDDVENIPRIKRANIPTAEVFFPDQENPERFVSDYMATYVRHRNVEETVTQRRMNTTPQQLAEILDAGPGRFIPNYSLKPIPPQEQFETTYNSTFKRFN